nr:PREDICTED: LOW QUALITY PROTEIN: L-fucose kinase [Opisthocomus hoazin]
MYHHIRCQSILPVSTLGLHPTAVAGAPSLGPAPQHRDQYQDQRIISGPAPQHWNQYRDQHILPRPAPQARIDWDGFQGVRVIAVPGSQAYARNHGVYLADEQGLVCDIIYKGTEAQIQQCARPDGTVPLVCGVVFFSSDAAEQLLATHVIPPLDACTYMGLDSGAPPMQLSLFFDIVLCMARGVTEEEFLKGGGDASVRSARSVLWTALRAFPLSMACIPDASYDYMTTSARDHICSLTRLPGSASHLRFCKTAHSHVDVRPSVLSLAHARFWGVAPGCAAAARSHVPLCPRQQPCLLEDGSSVTNCLLEGAVRLAAGSAIQHCHLQGLVPGIKIGRSKAQLPLRVEGEEIPVPDGFTQTLSDHLLLVYTGKTRLARNLLQDVVRSWYARLPSAVQNADALVSNAEECARALRQGNLPLVGKCLDHYWQQKKCMAPGCEPLAQGREPLAVRHMMAALQPYVYGQCLAGAGGGGFLYILTKAPRQKEALHQILAKTEGLGNFSIHSIEVDMGGFSVEVVGCELEDGARPGGDVAV